MKRILVTASHHRMADGLKDTLEFISGGIQETIALSAYVDNRPVEDAVEELMNGFAEEEEVIVLTDLTSGSVNQQFFKYRSRPHTHIVSGMNLPLAFQIAMEPKGEYITTERMREIVEESRQELRYINEIADDGDEEDE
ncbi:MAG: PTS N-acetylglucosamine transporter subunit IIBC [Lachnospiraceae bacterium]|nr:PTS N-acetylglucosamine transporter subunit IIBC [Lachnospiraceae bacterium]